MNILNGGKHAANPTDFQEFKADSTSNATDISIEDVIAEDYWDGCPQILNQMDGSS